MSVSEILETLSTYTGVFPREAVEAASGRWEEVAEEFLGVLEYTAENVEEVASREEYMLHTYAMFLCAEKRETRALLPMLRILSCPNHEALKMLLGDTLSEDAGRIVASLYDGDIAPIQELIEDSAALDYARSQAINALHILVLHGHLERETVIEYLRTLFEERLERRYSHVWNIVATTAARLGAAELIGHIETAYAEELVDPSFAREEALKEEIRLSRTEALRESRRDGHLTLVEDAVAAMEWWAAFEDSSTSARGRRNASNFSAALAATAGGTSQRSERKVGRNEPCPCGSGRKYKHCCGR